MDSFLEDKCRSLFSAAATCVFSQLYLQDPGFDVDAVVGPVAPESRAASTAAAEGHVDTLLKKFACISDTEPLAVEASGGEDGDSNVGDELEASGMSSGDGDDGPSS